MRARLGAEQMDDHVARIDQHPVALLPAFDRNMRAAGPLELFDQMVRHRGELPRIGSGRDDHEIGDGTLPGEFDAHDVLGLVGVERRLDGLDQGADGGGRGFTRATGGYLGLLRVGCCGPASRKGQRSNAPAPRGSRSPKRG